MKTPPRTQPARRTLHVLHAANFLVLTATGLLIQFPDWRAALLGGYGMLMSSLHHWCGVVFGVLPVLLILAATSTPPAIRASESETTAAIRQRRTTSRSTA